MEQINNDFDSSSFFETQLITVICERALFNIIFYFGQSNSIGQHLIWYANGCCCANWLTAIAAVVAAKNGSSLEFKWSILLGGILAAIYDTATISGDAFFSTSCKLQSILINFTSIQ